ncbi:hypothetical protein [Roseibium sp.]|uniref:hypothetical protein n=1 Tax=Roseibium sp. TaxID=1936156 RepID=UPI003A98135A
MISSLLDRTLALTFLNLGTLLRVGWPFLAALVALDLYIGVKLFDTRDFMTLSYLSGAPAPSIDEDGLVLLAIFANVSSGFIIATAYLRTLLAGAPVFSLNLLIGSLAVFMKFVTLGFIGLIAAGIGTAVTFILFSILLNLMPDAMIGNDMDAFGYSLGLTIFVGSAFLTLLLAQRFALVLPAAAIGDPLTYRESWHATRGLGASFSMTGLLMCLIAVVFLAILGGLIYGIVSFEISQLSKQLLVVTLAPLGTLVIIVWIFASLHAAQYHFVRENYAARLEFGHDERELDELANG